MTPAARAARARALALEAGFDLAGVASAEAPRELGFFQDWIARGYAGEMAYLTSQRDRRSDLRTAFPWLLPGIIGLALLAAIPIAYEFLLSLTDMRLSSLKDGLNGGVLRESLGGLTGQIPPASFNFDVSPHQVSYVGADLLTGVTQGIWLGNQTSAAFII